MARIDDLIRRFRFHQRAAIDENATPVGDEGVERTVVDDDDPNVLLRETCRPQQRLGVLLEQLLDLGVADDRRAAPLCACGHARAGEACADKRGCGDDGEDAGR
jgi:hypothetical protein